MTLLRLKYDAGLTAYLRIWLSLGDDGAMVIVLSVVALRDCCRTRMV